jgi:hypothetical protein
MVDGKAGHEPVSADCFRIEARIADWQRHDRSISRTRDEFLYKLNGIAVRGPART